MGTNSSKSYARFNQEINNSIYERISSSCKSACLNVKEGTTVIIIDTKLPGGIYFTQTCEARADCGALANRDYLLEESIKYLSEENTNIQNSSISIGGSNISSEAYLSSRIRNQISQIISSSCNASSFNLLSNNLVYIRGGQIGGNVEFTQEASSVANCAMNNIARINYYDKIASESKQSNTITDVTLLSLMILTILVIFIILGFIIFLLIKQKK